MEWVTDLVQASDAILRAESVLALILLMVIWGLVFLLRVERKEHETEKLRLLDDIREKQKQYEKLLRSLAGLEGFHADPDSPLDRGPPREPRNRHKAPRSR